MTFAKDFIKLVSGTATAQAINIAIIPILSRIYNPESFGVAAIFLSVVSVFAPVMCLRYELSIMLPKSEDEAKELFELCVIINVILTFVSMIIISIIYFNFSLFVNDKIRNCIFLIPIILFVQGLYLSFTYWFSRKSQFSSLSMASVLKPISANSIKLVAGLKGYVFGVSLLAGDISGRIIEVLYLLIDFCRGEKNNKTKFKKDNLLKLAVRYKNFPIYSSWGIFLNNLSTQIPIFLLAVYFDSKVIGFFAISMKMQMMPIEIMGNALSKVFFQRAAQIYAKNIIPSELVQQLFRKIYMIGIFPCLIIIFWGKELTVFLLGNTWETTGQFIQIMGPVSLVLFIASTLGPLYAVYEKQGIALILNIIKCVLHTIALIIGGMTNNVFIAVSLFAISSIVVRMVDIGWFLKLSKVEFKRILSDMVFYTAFSLILTCLSYYFTIKYCWTNWMIYLSLIIISSIYYYIVLFPFFRKKLLVH
ncbi:MAG: lipopolysaccharide biosynthesis protein [Proteobacteria bacterium]|nr:lipopolysaccharide biosynthesis protein [Pseudomonadota bacterium]